MRVWFAAAIPPDSRGGVRRVMEELGSGLSLRGHTVTLLTLPHARRSYLWFCVHLAWRWVCTRPRPDWVVARSCDGYVVALLTALLPRSTTRVALHNHGWEEKVWDVERRLPPGVDVVPVTGWKARLVRFPLLRATLRLCACCLCETVDEMRWIRRRYPSRAQRVRYLPTGVSVPPCPRWPGQEHYAPNVLFVGGDTWKKNLRGALALFAALRERIPGACWHGVGTGPLDPMLRRAAGADARWVEQEDPAQMGAWYTTCPVLLSLSRYEGGHPLAVLEAMSWGCVVVTSPVLSTLEVIRHGHNGLCINPGDPGAAAAVLARCLQDPRAFSRLGYAAWRTAHHHRWERQVQRLERILA